MIEQQDAAMRLLHDVSDFLIARLGSAQRYSKGADRYSAELLFLGLGDERIRKAIDDARSQFSRERYESDGVVEVDCPDASIRAGTPVVSVKIYSASLARRISREALHRRTGRLWSTEPDALAPALGRCINATLERGTSWSDMLTLIRSQDNAAHAVLGR